MKRSFMAGLMAATVFVAGCSDYPSTGVVDTREVRERADIEEITGKAFGLTKVGETAVTAYHEDVDALRSARYHLWTQYGDQGTAESVGIGLSYPGVDSSAMSAYLDQVANQVVTAYDGALAGIEAEINDANKAIESSKVELAALEEADAAFKAATASEQKAYDQAVQELEDTQNQMRELFHDTGVKFQKLAEKVGFTGRRALNVNTKILTGYRIRDYAGVDASRQPKECPPLRGYEPIDIRDLNEQCAYLHVGTIYLRDPAVEKQARQYYRDGFRAFAELMVKAGEDGRRAPKSGLHAKIESLKAELNEAYAEAAKTHGGKAQRESQIATLNRKIQDLMASIERAKSDDYREDVLSDARYALKLPEGFTQARKAYEQSMINDLFQNHIIALSDIRMHPESELSEGYFDEVGGDYTNVVTVTDILTNSDGHKSVYRSVGVASLTAPEMADADVIRIPVKMRGLDHRGRDTSLEQMQEDLLEYLEDQFDKA